ncbi:MAG: hypothetical protein AB7O65_05720 [Candidatus Korobacteraceae bacterium]
MAQRILLVDDDAAIAYQRTLILGLHGFKVDVAGTIADAEDLRRRHSYDLILVELRDDVDTATIWCEEIKQQNPNQQFALLAPKYAYVPSDCPDDVIHKDGPAHFVERVKRLLESAPAN